MFPKVKLAHLPTPIENLPRLSRLLNGPEIIIKRDDQTGLAFGGNKTRKLEYLLGAAVAEGADVVFTTGAAQSNHCRQTAAAAARCGLDCTLVLVGPEPDQPSANLFLDQLMGAKILWTENNMRDRTLKEAFETAGQAGKKPYLIPYGGSNDLGAYAYLKAFEELNDQLLNEMPDWIIFASSSGGTQAGLQMGKLIQESKSKVQGISVDQPGSELVQRIHEISQELGKFAGLGRGISQNEILVNDNYIGEGYGMMNDLDREAIHLFAKQEGILLDPVYTGRAAAGLIDLIRQGLFKKGERVLFWHTGGTTALFAAQYLPYL
ncbi:MAG: D-cysteine desulfhydrase family protein [Anaerolineales bacterium]|nr:D-cysteine desulfhydrase family protein [Anaerolineales bacterium]